jgi:Domain of unknown function (DUF4160)
MPTALRTGPYRFYFYSYDCGEPRHMHVDRENRSAKFWLDPDVALVLRFINDVQVTLPLLCRCIGHL